MAVAFDTLKAASRLRDHGGFSERQATELVATFADGFVENLATKADVAALRGEMANMEASLRGDVEHLRGDVEHLRGEMGKMALRTDLERTEASLRGEIAKLEQRVTLRLGGAIAAAVAILVAVDKLF